MIGWIYFIFIFFSKEFLFYIYITNQDGATPLHYAVQVGAMQTVKLLIKYKVDVNAADYVSGFDFGEYI